MLDVYVFQGIVSLLLFLYIIKPAVKNFQNVPGVTLMPILACVVTALAFVVTGYQPQLALLALYALWQAVTSLPALSRQASRLKTDDWRDVPRLRIVIRLAILIAVAGTAFRFAPGEPAQFSGFSQAPWQVDARVSLQNASSEPPSTQAIPFALYPPPKTKAGKEDVLILIVPPALGSMASVDRMAREFASRGFWTATHGSPGADFPASLSDGSRVWPKWGPALAQGIAGITHPASARALRQRAHTAPLKAASTIALHQWLEDQSRRGWPAIEGGPASFRPARMAVIGLGDGASAAIALAQSEGQVWTIDEEAPVLPLTALILTEPLFFETPPAKEDTAPGSITALLQKAALWIGFPRLETIPPTRSSTNPFDAPIPLLVCVAEKPAGDAQMPLRQETAKLFVDDHRAPAALIAIRGARPSALFELSCRTPLAALALDGEASPCRPKPDSSEATADDIPRAVAIQTAFLEQALYGIQVPDETAGKRVLHLNTHWQYPITEGILGTQ